VDTVIVAIIKIPISMETCPLLESNLIMNDIYTK